MAYRSLITRFAPLASVLALIVAACTLVGNENNAQKFSFNKSYDTLAQFDSVVITLRDTTGKTIDVLYRGKADTVREIENLPAPHWNGSGIVLVSVVGYDSGVVVYHVDKKLNGANDQVLDTIRIILPKTLLSTTAMDLSLTEGDSVPFPKISVTPIELSDKSLTYTSSAPTLLFVGDGYLRALQRGTAILKASLNSNPTKILSITVTILANPLTPDALTLAPDTLRLAAGGATGALAVRVAPSSADASVSWRMLDTTIARFSADGLVQGLKAGQTAAVASSLRKLSLSDSSLIVVQAPVPVASVRFLKDSLDLFVGGAAESLMVMVLPALANPKVDFSVANPALISLSGGRVQGLAEGKTLVIAKSSENPTLADTLAVVVFPTQKIDSVSVSPDSVKLYTGGTAATLTGKVYPATSNQSLLWRVRNEAIAAAGAPGSVSARAPGRTYAIGYSRVDSTKKDSSLLIVKRDVPLLSVGRDTVLAIGSTLVIRPVVSQEYGSIVKFGWDGNGDGTFEGVSDTLKPVSLTFPEAKEVIAGFSVKDSEGNDTTVYKKIKAVAGPAVQILSPLDSTYTRLFAIDVVWTVNGKEQDSLKKEILKLGANPVTRSAKDEAGNPYSATVTVIVDTTPPNKPVVRGLATTASKTPTWTWATGGGGGNGSFKYWLDVDDSSKGKLTTDTTFTPGTEQAEGIHTLFVAERDRAGNWSLPGRFAIRIDLSAPGMPKVSTVPSGPTNVRKPKWVWSSGGNGVGAYQYKLDNANLATGATATTDTAYAPLANLANGSHTLYVQERDSAGNWSVSGSAAIVIDTIAPLAPTVSAAQTSPTNEPRPTWNWVGGGGGRGFYRYKIGDTVWSSGGLQGSVTQYRPDAGLTEGARTLYVAEQDSAGNWSAAGSFGLTLDLTAPGAPKMDSTPYSPLNTLKPTWTWKTGGGGNGIYRVRVSNPAMTGSDTVSGLSFTQPSNLPEGKHTLYVQERDAAGNWSTSAIRELVLSIRGNVGSAGFSADYSVYHSMAINTADIPYVAFSDGSLSGKLTVMRQIGTSWENVGSAGFSPGEVYSTSLAFNPATGLPYVAFQDAVTGRAGVMRYTGSEWVNVGSMGFSDSITNDLSLAFTPTGIPYVAFTDWSVESKVSVMRYNGSIWEVVQRGLSEGVGYRPSLAISKSGEIFVAFADNENGGVTVKTFSGSVFENVGAKAFWDLGGGAISLRISSNGSPYVAFQDYGNLRQAVVMRFNGTGWVNVGNTKFSASYADRITLDLTSADVPYVAFMDYANSNKLSVMKLIGTSWNYVGGAGLSVESASWPFLALNSLGVPYVVFADNIQGSRTTVMKVSFSP